MPELLKPEHLRACVLRQEKLPNETCIPQRADPARHNQRKPTRSNEGPERTKRNNFNIFLIIIFLKKETDTPGMETLKDDRAGWVPYDLGFPSPDPHSKNILFPYSGIFAAF